MRKQCLRILIALFSLAGLGMATRAQVRDQIVVTIPFEFAVAGKTLPAGTYNVNRVTDSNPRTLILHSFEIHTSVLIVPSQVESGSTDKAHVSFERVGGQYCLSKIATADNVFTIRVPGIPMMEASANNNAPAPSSSGGK